MKKQKQFDFAKTVARHVCLRISYLGQNYCGFTGKETDTFPTVERELFKALTTCKLIPSSDECKWARAGRTDKGVSGFGQVASLWIRSNLPASNPQTKSWELIKQMENTNSSELTMTHTEIEDDGTNELPYLSMINRLLPKDIRILAWCPAPPNFDARFSCTYRKYKYFFPNKGLDLQLMQQAAGLFVGTFDCRNICKIDSSKVDRQGFFTRTIYEAYIEPASDDFSVFIVKGRAFLWHQVRNMMALLFMVGKGLEPPSIITTMLDLNQHPKDSGKPHYDMADDAPLVLLDCGYSSLNWRLKDSPKCINSSKVLANIDEQLREAQLKVLQLQTLRKEFLDLGAVQENIEKPKMHVPLMKRRRCDSVSEHIKKKGKSG